VSPIPGGATMPRGAMIAGLLLATLCAGHARALDLVSTTPASLLREGEIEAKLQFARYTQTEYFDDRGRRTAGARATYTTGTLSILVGSSGAWNPGVEITLRSVRDDAFPSETRSRTTLTAVHPRVKLAPWRRLPTLSVETGLRLPVAHGLGGSSRRPFLDWDDPIWNTRLLLDLRLRRAMYAYLEAGAALRVDAHAGDAQLTTPLQAILNWIPVERWTFYVPVAVAPDWIGDPRGDYWSQIGLGAKFRPRSDVELEALATTLPAGRNAGAGRNLLLGVRVAP
jgi:hypothetical protein